jgi:PAS domain S-box-containing protein
LRAIVTRTTAQERLERTQFTAQNQASVAKTTLAIIIDEIIAFIIIILILFKLNRDITRRIISEKLLKESEIKYRAIALNIKNFTYTCDYYGKINFVTPNIEKLTGYTPDEIVGKDFTFMVAPEMVDEVKESKYSQFKNRIKEETRELEIITKSGQRKLVEQEVIVFSTDSMQMGFQCTIRDISGRSPEGK